MLFNLDLLARPEPVELNPGRVQVSSDFRGVIRKHRVLGAAELAHQLPTQVAVIEDSRPDRRPLNWRHATEPDMLWISWRQR